MRDTPTLAYQSTSSDDLGAPPRSIVVFAASFGLIQVIYIPWMLYILEPLTSFRPTFRYTFWPVVSGVITLLCAMLLMIATFPAMLGRPFLQKTAVAALLVITALKLGDMLWMGSDLASRNVNEIAIGFRGVGHRLTVVVITTLLLALFGRSLTRSRLLAHLRIAFAVLSLGCLLGMASEIIVYALNWGEVRSRLYLPRTLSDVAPVYTLFWTFILPASLFPACVAGAYPLFHRRHVTRALEVWLLVAVGGGALSLLAAAVIACANLRWIDPQGFLEALWLPVSIVYMVVNGQGVAVLLLLVLRYLRRHAVSDFS